MKDEFPGKTIEEVICAGNKQYAIVLRSNDKGEVRRRRGFFPASTPFNCFQVTQKIKCKGFTQNSETCKILTVENMRRMVLAPPDDPIVLDVPVDVFDRDERANVFTRRSTKRNKIAYRKSWIHKRQMYPYGYNLPASAWTTPTIPSLSSSPAPSCAGHSPEYSSHEPLPVWHGKTSSSSEQWSPLSSPLPTKRTKYRPVSPSEDPNRPCCSKSLLY